MRSRNEAISVMLDLVTDPSHGYAQDHRDGPDYDCSSACCEAYGLEHTNTSGIPDLFAENGCDIYDYDGNPDDLEPGDLVGIAGVHVVMIGPGKGQDMAFRINSQGGISDDEEGDQTGDESRVEDFDSDWYEGRGAYVVSPPHDGSSYSEPADDHNSSSDSGEFDRTDGFTGNGVLYSAMLKSGWLPEVSKADDTDDGFAGSKDQEIFGLQARRADGQSITLIGHVCGRPEDEWLSPCIDNVTAEGDGFCGDPDVGPLDCFKPIGCSARGGVAGQGYFPAVINGQASDGDDYVGEFGKPLVDVQFWV